MSPRERAPLDDAIRRLDRMYEIRTQAGWNVQLGLARETLAELQALGDAPPVRAAS